MLSATLVMNMLIQQGIPYKDLTMLTCIAHAESNFNPKAINKYNSNGTRDHGLFQINDINKKLCGVTSTQLLNAHTNVKCAVKIYKTQNLKAWTTYELCKKELYNVSSHDSHRLNNRNVVYSVRPQQEVKVSERRQSSREAYPKESTSWALIGYVFRSH